MKISIYILKMPDWDTPFYVGKSNDLKSRLHQHLSKAKAGIKIPIYRFIKAHLPEKPLIIEIDSIECDSANDEVVKLLEHKWIKYYEGLGIPLLNVTAPYKEIKVSFFSLSEKELSFLKENIKYVATINSMGPVATVARRCRDLIKHDGVSTLDVVNFVRKVIKQIKETETDRVEISGKNQMVRLTDKEINAFSEKTNGQTRESTAKLIGISEGVIVRALRRKPVRYDCFIKIKKLIAV